MSRHHPNRSSITAALACLALGALSGCTCFGLNLQTIPANRLPPEVLGRPRDEMQQISISRLRQNRPESYQLAPGDVLGIYIQNVLGGDDEAPPVHFPQSGDQPPALGFPVPVQEDGTLSLPYIPPVDVEGLTLAQARAAIQDTYTRHEVLAEDQFKILLTLMRPRTYSVTVIREEGGGREGILKRGTGELVELPAYKNDVLNALNRTGGLPGLDAKNEIFILRGDFADGVERDRVIALINSCREPCECPPLLPEHPTVIRIPLRFYPEEVPEFTEEDIILSEGDIVYIPARDSERFYTGGVLGGGEFLLPRDYDIDVLNAVAIARGDLGSGGTGLSRVGMGGGRGGGMGQGARAGGIGASELIVVRKLPCGGQIPIRVDLHKAIEDESHRILIQPEDMLILRFTLAEELYNAALGLLQFNFITGLGGRGI
jgi:hypothetical protein